MIDDMYSPSGLLSDLEKRKNYVSRKLFSFMRQSATLSFLFLVIIEASKLVSTPEISDDFIFNISISSIIIFSLQFMLSYVNFLFFIFSVTLIPYTIYLSLDSSTKETKSMSGSFIWFSLFLSSALPIIIIGLFWVGLSKKDIDIDPAFFNGINDLVIFFVGTPILYYLLRVINNIIPINQVIPRIAILSSILWLSLFVTYGAGGGIYSTMVFVTLFLYVMTNSNEISRIGSRIITYDYDDKTIENLDKLIEGKKKNKYESDNVVINKERLDLKDKQLGIKKTDLFDKEREATLDEEINFVDRMTEIKNIKGSFEKKTSNILLTNLNKKVSVLQKMQNILSDQYDVKVDEVMRETILSLEINSKNMSPEELRDRMASVIIDMDKSFKDIPEELNKLKTVLSETLDQAVLEMGEQRKLVAKSSTNNDSIENTIDNAIENTNIDVFNPNIASGLSKNQEIKINLAYEEKLKERIEGQDGIFVVNSMKKYFSENSLIFDRLLVTLLSEDIGSKYSTIDHFTDKNIRLIPFFTPSNKYVATVVLANDKSIVILSVDKEYN